LTKPKDTVIISNVDKTELGEITGRLDQIISLLKAVSQPVPRIRRVLEIFATVAGILGIISVIDIIVSWFGG